MAESEKKKKKSDGVIELDPVNITVPRRGLSEDPVWYDPSEYDRRTDPDAKWNVPELDMPMDSFGKAAARRAEEEGAVGDYFPPEAYSRGIHLDPIKIEGETDVKLPTRAVRRAADRVFPGAGTLGAVVADASSDDPRGALQTVGDIVSGEDSPTTSVKSGPNLARALGYTDMSPGHAVATWLLDPEGSDALQESERQAEEMYPSEFTQGQAAGVVAAMASPGARDLVAAKGAGALLTKMVATYGEAAVASAVQTVLEAPEGQGLDHLKELASSPVFHALLGVGAVGGELFSAGTSRAGRAAVNKSDELTLRRMGIDEKAVRQRLEVNRRPDGSYGAEGAHPQEYVPELAPDASPDEVIQGLVKEGNALFGTTRNMVADTFLAGDRAGADQSRVIAASKDATRAANAAMEAERAAAEAQAGAARRGERAAVLKRLREEARQGDAADKVARQDELANLHDRQAEGLRAESRARRAEKGDAMPGPQPRPRPRSGGTEAYSPAQDFPTGSNDLPGENTFVEMGEEAFSPESTEPGWFSRDATLAGVGRYGEAASEPPLPIRGDALTPPNGSAPEAPLPTGTRQLRANRPKPEGKVEDISGDTMHGGLEGPYEPPAEPLSGDELARYETLTHQRMAGELDAPPSARGADYGSAPEAPSLGEVRAMKQAGQGAEEGSARNAILRANRYSRQVGEIPSDIPGMQANKDQAAFVMDTQNAGRIRGVFHGLVPPSSRSRLARFGGRTLQAAGATARGIMNAGRTGAAGGVVPHDEQGSRLRSAAAELKLSRTQGHETVREARKINDGYLERADKVLGTKTFRDKDGKPIPRTQMVQIIAERLQKRDQEKENAR